LVIFSDLIISNNYNEQLQPHVADMLNLRKNVRSSDCRPAPDKGRILKISRFLWKIPVFLLCVCIVIGCQAPFMRGFQGSFVPENLRTVLLPGGPHEAFWQTDEIGVSFRYQREKDRLQLTGTVELSGHLQNYDSVESFHLRGWFLDAGGRVLDGKGLLSGGKNDDIVSWPFKREMTLPEGTVSISFSYSGRANTCGSDESGQDFWDFQMRPFSNPDSGPAKNPG